MVPEYAYHRVASKDVVDECCYPSRKSKVLGSNSIDREAWLHVRAIQGESHTSSLTMPMTPCR